ncbi:MAG: hypothetical protein ACKVQB_05500 [Bacteroidia bacterium]
MKEVYRIKEGTIQCENKTIPFYFGLIFEEEGLFFFDFYISESFDLYGLKNSKLLNYDFTMFAKTEINNEIEANELYIKTIYWNQSKIQMVSYGHLQHTDNSFKSLIDKDKKEENPILYFLEIEGLKIEFSNLTETIRARSGVKIDDFNNSNRDHTTALLIYDSPTNLGCNNILFTFSKNKENDNIIVALPNGGEIGRNILHYSTFKEFKRELVSLLSFLNGAEVEIRKEFIGGFYNIGRVNSQTIITYSFKNIKNERYNNYVPINSGFHISKNILNSVFIHCFNKYIEANKKLDLNSIIFYMNGAEQARSIEQKFFIQIIAFERLSQKYIETIKDSETFIIPDKDFKKVKHDLLNVLKSHSEILGNKFDILSGRIGDIHKAKSAKYKFLKLLEYAKIEITPDIKNIIEEVRHKSIHRGEIGKARQGLINSLTLDQLLRDIILNIIGYNQVRISSIN